ncbi:VWA domain-containing protein [Polaribacter sp. P097]|uniref:VWA domain-containing protein n=1 Tax=Polaribacter sp. P097 TaxID=3117398 RepID=UPI002FE0ACA0
MTAITYFLILLALLISVLIAYYQYFYRQNNNSTLPKILLVLKFSSLFLLLILLINPKIESTKITNEKPVLTLLVDNSSSIDYFEKNQTVNDLIAQLESNKALANKFSIEKFSFGNDLQIFDSLSFDNTNTNISKAIQDVNELQKGKKSPIVVLTDGNQTKGLDYSFITSEQSIYPIVIGDTTKYEDVSIAQVNVNKYSYLNNKFPVEIILNYDGTLSNRLPVSIIKNGKRIYQKQVNFSKTKKSATISAELESLTEGLQYYTVSVGKLENEKNSKNNVKSFFIEVINEQTKIALISSIVHPDIGALKKAIESNKQRSLENFSIDKFKENVSDYQLVILYQPTIKFNAILNQLKKSESNYWLISGANTNWSFINQQNIGISKNAINQTENLIPFYNESFLTFLQEDINFNNLPPLTDKFGDVTISGEKQTLIFQNLNGVITKQPLLTFLESNSIKKGFLLGEGIWKWRANSYLNTNSFEEFDSFVGNIIQYLASTKKRNRLEVNVESIYPANSSIKIAAFYTDKNYRFDDRANLEIKVTNSESKEVTSIPFSLVKKSYQAEIENLASGDYFFEVIVENQNIRKTGRFKVSEFEIEQQFTNANKDKLNILALNTGGQLYYPDEIEQLSKELMSNENYYTIQKSNKIEVNLINWKWLLFVSIALLSIEWFVRKYNGKI